MQHRLDEIVRSQGRSEGMLSAITDQIKINAGRLMRIEQKTENLDTRLRHIERQERKPSSTPANSWHSIIALVIALLAGTLMNLAPKEMAQIVLHALGK